MESHLTNLQQLCNTVIPTQTKISAFFGYDYSESERKTHKTLAGKRYERTQNTAEVFPGGH